MTVIGDSVMLDASFGIRAALGATGEVATSLNTIDGFGLVNATIWPQAFPQIIRETRAQIIVASWSWDDSGPTTPNALHQPAQYTKLLHRAVATLLAPGNGVEGVMFTQWPYPVAANTATPQERAVYRDRVRGNTAWTRIAEEMTRQFPGRVMYLPIASSLTWHGKYLAWLPPSNEGRTPLDQWVRARKLDNLHLCPEGAARYADALLTDMRAVFSLTPASPDWMQGDWTSNSNYNDPPGDCPDDHPTAYP